MSRLLINVLLEIVVLFFATQCESKSIPNIATGNTVSTRKNYVIMNMKYSEFVAVFKNGTVKLTTNRHNKFAKLQLQSLGNGIVRIYGRKSRRYIAMDARGHVYSTTQTNNDTMFHQGQELGQASLWTFYSATHFKAGPRRHPVDRRLYLAFKENRLPKRGTKTRRTNRASHFADAPKP